MTAVAARNRGPRRDPNPPRPRWEAISARAPVLAATLGRYVDQIAACQRPGTARACESDLRGFATFVTGHDPAVAGVADVNRGHVEAYKIHLAARGLKPATIRRRLQTLRTLFVRITDWEWDDAPARVPVLMGDLPVLDDALPKFLDDAAFAQLMRAVAAEGDVLRRLVIEVLARTGMRVGELCDLQADAVVRIGAPIGCASRSASSTTTATSPCTPTWWNSWPTTAGSGPPPTAALLITNHDGAALNRHVVTRMLKRVAKAAGLGHLHPHRLRHTLATQAVNSKMGIAAIAALLGHRCLDMTRRYARISDRTVADEYQAVSAQIEDLYGQPLPAEAEGPHMRRLRQEHQRMLGNGWCNRPALMDCSFESICETCTYFSTGVEFQPVLFRQRQHAQDHGQTKRAELFDHLLDNINP